MSETKEIVATRCHAICWEGLESGLDVAVVAGVVKIEGFVIVVVDTDIVESIEV